MVYELGASRGSLLRWIAALVWRGATGSVRRLIPLQTCWECTVCKKVDGETRIQSPRASSKRRSRLFQRSAKSWERGQIIEVRRERSEMRTRIKGMYIYELLFFLRKRGTHIVQQWYRQAMYKNKRYTECERIS